VGLGAALKFPFCSTEAPYSIVAAATVCLPQRLAMPFSLVNSTDMAHAYAAGSSVVHAGSRLEGRTALSPALNALKPAWILWGNPYFIERWEGRIGRSSCS
jgi:hypothetical protein